MVDRVARTLVEWEGSEVAVEGSPYFEQRRFVVGPGDVIGVEGLQIEGDPEVQYRVVLYGGGTAWFIGEFLPAKDLERVLVASTRLENDAAAFAATIMDTARHLDLRGAGVVGGTGWAPEPPEEELAYITTGEGGGAGVAPWWNEEDFPDPSTFGTWNGNGDDDDWVSATDRYRHGV